MTIYTFEQQFAVVHPLHAVIFCDAGNTWDMWREIQPFDLKVGAGVGFRMEIPILGNIGFDYGYGFQHEQLQKNGTYRKGQFKGHFLLGNFGF